MRARLPMTGACDTCRARGAAASRWSLASANVFEPDWVERDQPPLIGRARAERLGATLYEMAPGGYGSSCHLHHSNEEMIVVLRGAADTTDALQERASSSLARSSPALSARAARTSSRTPPTSRSARPSSARWPMPRSPSSSTATRSSCRAQRPVPLTGSPLAFPREAQVDRLAGELRSPNAPAG
jgi:hypothetical protein